MLCSSSYALAAKPTKTLTFNHTLIQFLIHMSFRCIAFLNSRVAIKLSKYKLLPNNKGSMSFLESLFAVFMFYIFRSLKLSIAGDCRSINGH